MKHFWLICAALAVASCSKDSGSGRIVIESPTPAIANGKLVEAIGVEAQSGAFEPLLKQGCAVPCVVGRDLVLSRDQRQMTLRLYRGNAPLAKDTHALGLVTIAGLVAVPDGEEVTVMFNLAAGSEGITVFAHQMGENVDLNISVAK